MLRQPEEQFLELTVGRAQLFDPAIMLRLKRNVTLRPSLRLTKHRRCRRKNQLLALS